MRSRPPMTPQQVRAVWTTFGEQWREEARARARAGKPLGKCQGVAGGLAGSVRDRLGDMTGLSGRKAEMILEVYAAAEAEPARFARAVDYLERTGNALQAAKFVRRLRDEARVLGLRPVAGKFRTLVVDPPWRDESVSEYQRPPYATMSVEEIRAVPVESWAEDDAHLYLWTTPNFMAVACELVPLYGFTLRNVIAWDKLKFSMGRYFRIRAEYVIFATRGEMMTRRQDVPNIFTGKAGEDHSEKPDSFYDVVRTASYPPYGEAFQRKPQPDFPNLYELAPPALEAAE